jgi:hypothetical protein
VNTKNGLAFFIEELQKLWRGVIVLDVAKAEGQRQFHL